MRKLSRVALVLAILLLAVAVPTVAAKDNWFFPDAGSQTQREWQELFTQVFWVALVVFVLVEGLLVYALVRFRRRKGGPQEGPHIHGNTKMEVAWTIAPTLVMAWLLVVSLQQLDRIDNGPEPDFTVDVVASQFLFQFYYPPDYATGTASTLYVQEDQVVQLRVTAQDVIHAFNIPELGVMIDAVPGKTNFFWFQADDPGEYKFQCRELCGAGHGAMNGTVVVFAAGSQPVPYGPPPQPEAEQPTNGTADGNGTIPPGARAQDVILDSFSIEPTTLDAQPGETLALRVENVASAPHNLYIGKFSTLETEWKTAEVMNQGDEEILILELPDQPSAWEWWCNIPGHKDLGMYGILSTGGTIETEGKQPILPGPSPLLAVVALLGVFFMVRARRRRA